VRIKCLGQFEAAEDQGRPLVLGGRKQRAVVAILVLHIDETVSSERLIDELRGSGHQQQQPRRCRCTCRTCGRCSGLGGLSPAAAVMSYWATMLKSISIGPRIGR
jgi:hypothetical protein